MKLNRQYVISALVVLSVFAIAPHVAIGAVNTSELHIMPDGALSSKSVIVFQKAGNNLFCRVAWGDTFIRMTLLIQPDTEITKKYGGKGTIADIKEGDELEIEGTLSDGTGNLVVKPKKVKNASVTVESKDITGTILKINTASSSVTVVTKSLGTIQVQLSASATIKKGLRMVVMQDLIVGDKILSAPGTYDFKTKTLSVSSMEVYQDKKEFAPRTISGTITNVAGTGIPTSVTVAAGPKTYTVYITQSTKVMSKSRAVVSLARMTVGDSVLVYGSLRETNLSEVNALSIRDTAF